MTVDQIVEIVMACLPSVMAILTTLGVFIKMGKQVKNLFAGFKETKEQIADMKCMEDIKVQLTQVLKENAELKATLNETMTKIDHVRRD